MKHKLWFVLVMLLLLGSCQRCQLKKDLGPKPEPWAEAVEFARMHLPLEGKLVQKSDGYGFVKVDDRYIHDLFPLLKAEIGFDKPPYFRRSDAPGAHISVFYANEHVVVTEVGQRFKFTLKDIVMVRTNNGVSYIVLLVDAPELEQLRQKYGLAPRLNNHEFHITIARKIDR